MGRARLPTPPPGFRQLPRLRSEARRVNQQNSQSQANSSQHLTADRDNEVIDNNNALPRRKGLKNPSIGKSRGGLKKEATAPKDKGTKRPLEHMSVAAPEQPSGSVPKRSRRATTVDYAADRKDRKDLFNQLVVAEAARLQEQNFQIQGTIATKQEEITRSQRKITAMGTELVTARASHQASSLALESLERKHQTFCKTMREAICEMEDFHASWRRQLHLPEAHQPRSLVPWDRVKVDPIEAKGNDLPDLIQAYTLVFDKTKIIVDSFCRGNPELFQKNRELRQQAMKMNALKEELEAANWRLNDMNKKLLVDNQNLRREVEDLRNANDTLTTDMVRLQNDLDELSKAFNQLQGKTDMEVRRNKELEAEIEELKRQLLQVTAEAGVERVNACAKKEMLQETVSDLRREVINARRRAFVITTG